MSLDGYSLVKMTNRTYGEEYDFRWGKTVKGIKTAMKVTGKVGNSGDMH